MQDIIETASPLGLSRRRIYVAPEGVALTERRALARWETPRLIPYEDIRQAEARPVGGQWFLDLTRASDTVRFGALRESEAQWIAGLINEELGFRARQTDPRFAAPVSFDQFPQAINTLVGSDAVALLVDFFVLQAVHHRASDVHFEPFPDGLRIRFRVDGMISEVAVLPAHLHAQILARIKVLSRLAIFRHDVPQEGRTVVESNGRSIDLRVSVLPTIHGEKAVARLFDSSRATFALEELGMSAEVLERYRQLIRRPQGTVILTGPANSGKTTTLYSTLKHLHETRRNLTNIVTVEDPVEYDLRIVSQTQVNPAVGLDFASGLRTVLRQDPEVIMVGEIRDPETAEIAVRAGLTGHLILSTAHARSAAGVFARIVEMGLEPFLVASSLTGVMEQRLVRRNCPDCRKAYTPEADLLRQVGLAAGTTFERGEGCGACKGQGFAGRTGVFALLTVDEGLRELILSKAPLTALEAASRRTSRGLLAEGLDKLKDGETTLEELLRVVDTEA